MKILYVTTLGTTMGFFPEHFKMLLDQGHTIHLACNNTEWPYKESVAELNLKTFDIPFSRSPFSKDNLRACKMIRKLVEEEKYDVIHTHTPNASLFTRLAVRKFRKKGTKVFYTAHGFHFFKGAPIKNWLIYFPAEWFCSFFTDAQITINTEDFTRAKKHLHAKRTEYIPGVGIDLEKYKKADIDISAKRRALGIPENAKLLLSVGELNENKNHETILRAIKDLDAYYIIAGKGEKYDDLEAVAKNLGISDRFKLLGYRCDINELLSASDIFVFPSYREGLSVSLMEAMANERPCAVSNIRGNEDLIDEKGGVLFNPESVDEAKAALTKLVGLTKEQLEALGSYNAKKIKNFSNEEVLQKLKTIY